MVQNEVEIPHDDYEIVPLTPLRRLEKRMEAMETTKSMSNLEKFIDKVIDMVEMNQKIVEEVVRANQGLREDISILISKIDDSQAKMTQFVEIIKDAGEQEGGETMSKEFVENVVAPMIEKIEAGNTKVAETNNQILETLSSIDKRLKGGQAPGVQLGRPAISNILQRRRPPNMPPAP